MMKLVRLFSKKSFVFVVIVFSFLLSIGYSLVNDNTFVSGGAKFTSGALLLSTYSSDTTAFRSSTYKTLIKTITFENKIDIDDNAIEIWDIGVHKNRDVIAYVVYNSSDSDYYDLYIQSDLKLYANPNMSYWFSGFTSLDSIVGLELLDTKFTTSMRSMFANAGRNSTVFKLDVSCFDTSNVTDMLNMFDSAGYSSPVFELNLKGLDTGNVTNMSGMFRNSGYSNTSFTLDVSGFDTSSVTDFSYMFHQTGYVSTIFTLDVSGFDTKNATIFTNMFRIAGYRSTVFALDVSGFDTKNATTMSGMFHNAGFSSKVFTLDVSGFDTSKVTNMSEMFYYTGYANPSFTLDVSGFDTSKVTNMSSMFYRTGYSSTSFTLDLSNFNTEKVTNMSNMFYGAGNNNASFTLDVSNFSTSKVTNMSHMFRETGRLNPDFTLDVSGFVTNNVTDMSNMFRGVAQTSKVFKLDLSNFDTSKVTNMSGMFMDAAKNSLEFTLDVSNFVTDNVTNLSHMFYNAGYNSPVFEIDVSGFKTSKVTLMDNMFYNTGYNNPEFSLDVSGFDTSKVTNMYGMFYCTGYNSLVFNIDLGNFDFSSATNMGNFLYYTGYKSTKFITSMTINNPDVSTYTNMFYGVATIANSRIIVYYDDTTEALVDLMLATKTTTSNVIKGGTRSSVVDLAIGDYVVIDNAEIFNVIDFDENNVTLFAAYSLNSDYRQQSGTAYATVTFAETGGWDYTPGPKEVDIQEWSTYPKIYVNEYVSYLQGVLNSENISGNLITLAELGTLDCDVPETYGWSGTHTCANSKYDWLRNGQNWWSRSAYNGNAAMVWTLNHIGYQSNASVTSERGIRPTVNIPIEVILTNSDKVVISKKDS